MYAKNTWEKYKDQLNEVFDYNEGYKHYISKNKTERACVKDSIKLAEEKRQNKFIWAIATALIGPFILSIQYLVAWYKYKNSII